MSKLVYIAGKVSGEDYIVAYIKFLRAEELLIKAGYTVVNPMRLVPCGTDWKTAMKKYCIPALCNCDILCELPDARISRGAIFEMYHAKTLEMEWLMFDSLLTNV